MADEAAQNPPQTEEGKQLLGDITGAEQQVNINKASEFYNLVQDLDPSQSTEIGKEIKRGYTDDEATRAEWLDMHEFWLRLYMQTDYALNSDDERDWGATESVPILTEACDQFQSRTYKAFFPNETFVSAISLRHTQNPEEQQQLKARAERVGRHMSWQLGIQNPNYKKDKRALFLGTAVHGSFFTKTYFDAYKKKRIIVDNIRPTDLVISYNIGPIRIEDVRRKSHVIHTTVGDTKILMNKGYLFEEARGDFGGSKSQYDVAVDESQGLEPGNNTIRRDIDATLIEQQFYLDLDDSGEFRPYLGTIDLATGKLLRLTIDYEADQMGNPTKDYEQIKLYTHYKYMENPDGFYGLGLGAKIGDLNAAVSIGMRQMLDAATLANDGNSSGYISNRLCMDGEEEVTMTIGKLKKVPDVSGDLSQGIMMMKFPGPSDAQFKIIEFLDGRAQRMAGTTEATTGDIQKNMQPTTVLAQIEQGLEQFSSVQMGLADDFGDELNIIYKLNQKHMPFVEYFSVNEVTEGITRQDYQDDMAIQPIFDPKFSTQSQKMARAQATAQVVMQNPFLAQNPNTMMELTRRELEALDVDNPDALVPPPPPPPANIDNQMQENMLFLMPAQQRPSFDVYPDQHHAQHLAEVDQFVAQHGKKLDPEQGQSIIQHRQKHEAYLYGQQHGLIPAPAPQPGAAQGMASGRNNGMGAAPTPQQISGLPAGIASPVNGAGLGPQSSGGMQGNA